MSDIESLILPVSIHTKIISNMEKHLPEEACGLITGKGIFGKASFSHYQSIAFPIQISNEWKRNAQGI